MKIFKKIELWTQIVLLTAAVGFGLALIYSEDAFTGFASTQLLLGFVQYFGSLISLIKQYPFSNLKRIHFAISTVYILFLFSGTAPHPFAIIQFFVGPWTLAIYYLFITYKWNFLARKNNGHFLPHTSF